MTTEDRAAAIHAAHPHLALEDMRESLAVIDRFLEEWRKPVRKGRVTKKARFQDTLRWHQWKREFDARRSICAQRDYVGEYMGIYK